MFRIVPGPRLVACSASETVFENCAGDWRYGPGWRFGGIDALPEYALEGPTMAGLGRDRLGALL